MAYLGFGDRMSRREKSSRKVSENEINAYLTKRAQNKALRTAEKLKTELVSDYSNDSNPFGDSNLNKKFVWLKKIERDVGQGVPLDEFSVKAEKKRERERMAEIEKVKRRRVEGLKEKERREKGMAFLARERVQAEFQEREKKEAEFVFEQSKIGSQIRLREGRAKPIDILCKYLDGFDESDIEMSEPYMEVFKGLTVKEMEEVADDIKMYVDSDRSNPIHILYWDALTVVCEWEIAEACKREALNQAQLKGEEPPILDRVLRACLDDIHTIMNGKTRKELEEIESDVQTQLRSGSAKVVDYWEALLKLLNLYKAKVCLKEILAGKKSQSQKRIREATVAAKPVAEDPIFELKDKKAKEAMEEVEARLDSSAEVNLDSQVYWWHDKYKPRKPKYFNSVYRGYDWNLYNRKHYDHDNPPPKKVKGYKFNIFYPDLVEKTKTPTYTVEKDGDSAETCIIRFHAGLPYEDIAFRIVKKDWEYSRKKMFKCTFERGILHLRFNFKRYIYRR